MNREIKYKVWDDSRKTMLNNSDFGSMIHPCDGGNNTTFLNHNEKLIIMLYTGLRDKNGNEIYEGFKLRCKYKIGDEPDHYVDAVYEVNKMDYEGVSLSYRGIYENNQDPNCQYPISQHPSFSNRALTIDSRNKNYGRLAFNETNGHNHMSRHTWKENHYSNDIEVIGNIYLT